MVSLLLPPVLKIGIGLVQVNNMIELGIRVKQGINLLVNSREGSFMGGNPTENMMADLLTHKQKVERAIWVCRTIVVLLSLTALLWGLVAFSLEMKESQYDRVMFVKQITVKLAWAFLALFFLLLVTTGTLVYMLTSQMKKVTELERSFKREAVNLMCILILFGSTYLLRFFSDKFIVINLLNEG